MRSATTGIGSQRPVCVWSWLADERLLGEELGLARSGAARLRWFLRWLVPAGIVAASVAPMFG